MTIPYFRCSVCWQLSEPTLAPTLSAPTFRHAPAPPLPADLFIPTDFQRDILAALAGKALRTDALAAKLDCGRSRMYADPGGLPELRWHGLVCHHPRLGFYRPDALPPEVRDALQPAA